MLDPEVSALLKFISASGAPSLDTLDPSQAKATYKATRSTLALSDREGVLKRDVRMEGPAGPITLRHYRPAAAAADLLPAMIFYHGGGFTVGDLDTHDGVCQLLCDAGGVAVVAVDYRLAPECRFPAAVEDAYAALCWVHRNGLELGIDTSRLAVGGDSAGGCLSAVVALLARDQEGPDLRLQMLIYPTTDLAHALPSHQKNGRDYLLTTELLHYFRDLYISSPGDIDDWRASPLRARDCGRLPPAWILVAGYDPLADEAEAYGERLREAGVDVTMVRYPGQIHGFVTMGAAIPHAAQALTEAAEALRAALVTTAS